MSQNYTKSNGLTGSGKPRFRPDPDKFLFNIDTLWLNVDSYYYDDVMDSGLRDLLIEGREHYSDFSDALSIDVSVAGYDNPISFDIFGGQAPMYQYSLRNDSMAIYFSKNFRENSSSMRIQINQFVLWDKGVEKAYKESLEVLKSLGFLPHTAKINRVDFAVHSDQFKWDYNDIKDLTYPVNIGNTNFPNVIKLNPFTMDFETCYHGDRSRCFLRIYNKTKEIEAKKKYYFYEIYNNKNMDISNIWNVEIEVRRPFLKELKENIEEEYHSIFDDFDQCLRVDGLSRLWSYLMTRYIHKSAFWSVLAKGDSNHFNFIEEHNLEVSKDIDSNFDREIAQIAGRLMTGVIDEEDYSLDHAISKFREKLYDLERDEKRLAWHELVEKKKSMIHNYKINRQIKKPTPRKNEK